MDTEALARALGAVLKEQYPELLNARYKLSGDEDILRDIAKSRGMLVSGGEPDTERAAAALLDEYRGGKIGRITLEKPGN